MRWIVHIDMDCFFVSAERLVRPELIGKVVAVGGTGRRGVITSASYEARAKGVRSAMPTSQALRVCPELIVVKSNFKLYGDLSRKIFDRLREVAPVLQQVSVDEAYLDLTGCEKIYGERLKMGQQIRDIVYEESKLPCSVGIATNKLVAKIASDFSKPNGLFEVLPGQEESFLAPLPLSRLPGVGPKTFETLKQKGLNLCADLAHRAAHWVREELGTHGLHLQMLSRGIHTGAVHTDGERKSYSSEETFAYDVREPEVLRHHLLSMADELGNLLRRDNVKARTVQIKVRFSDFSTRTRSLTLDEPSYLGHDLVFAAERMLQEFDVRKTPFRLFGLVAKNLVSAEKQVEAQLGLFADEIEQSEQNKNLRIEKVERLKDHLKSQFGRDVLVRAKPSLRKPID